MNLKLSKAETLELKKVLQSKVLNNIKNININVLQNISRDRKSTRLNSSHIPLSRMPSSA